MLACLRRIASLDHKVLTSHLVSFTEPSFGILPCVFSEEHLTSNAKKCDAVLVISEFGETIPGCRTFPPAWTGILVCTLICRYPSQHPQSQALQESVEGFGPALTLWPSLGWPSGREVGVWLGCFGLCCWWALCPGSQQPWLCRCTAGLLLVPREFYGDLRALTDLIT